MCTRGKVVGDICCTKSGKCKDALLGCNLSLAPCQMRVRIPVSVEFAQEEGGGIRDLATKYINLANQVLRNSKIPITMDLQRVKPSKLNDQGIEDPVELLGKFASNADRVHGTIQVYLSDKVRGCGITFPDCQRLGCMFIVASTLCDPLLFVRQLGFLMSAGTEPENQVPPSRFPYAYARIIERKHFTQTVMGSQLNAPRIPYFSTPSVWYKGWVLGVKNRQDNARVLTMRRYDWATLN